MGLISSPSAVGRRHERLEQLAGELDHTTVTPVAADLSTDIGLQAVAELCLAA
jgi:uncharacterized protein